jgi:hypothetical protein
MGGRGLNFSGLGYGSVTCSCERSDKPSGYINLKKITCLAETLVG